MKNSAVFLFFSFLLFSQLLSAEEFEVVSFRQDPASLVARRYPRNDINGRPCAVIKVMTDIRNISFSTNQGIEGDVAYDQGEYRVYVQPGERQIILKHPDFMPLYYAIETPIESASDYVMEVRKKGITIVTDWVKISFRINQEKVYIQSDNNAPVLSESGAAFYCIPKGEYTFRFFKEGFQPVERQLKVRRDSTVEISLSPGASTGTSMPLSGWIVITSEPSGAEVYLNNQRVGTTPFQQKQIAGTYDLSIRFPNHYDHADRFELDEGATLALPKVTLKPRFGYYQVKTEPQGAQVYLDNRPVGTTPISRVQISSGNHELKIWKDLYYEHVENFTIADGDDLNLDIPLRSAFGHLKITSEPSGAKVFLEGAEVGVTPYENLQQPSGNWNIKLSKDLHSDAFDQVTVTDGQPAERHVILTTNYGTLIVNAPESDIYLNDSKVGSSSYRVDLTPGQYTVKAVRPKHKDDERQVYILAFQTEEITLVPVAKNGALNISSRPFETLGAEIYIDGRKRPETTPATIVLLTGTYEVTVKKSGYQDSRKTIEVKEGQEQEFYFDMLTVAEYQKQIESQVKKNEVVSSTDSKTGGFTCGNSFTVTHVAGKVAPETKTVTYGTVSTDLTGKNKCWITQNLGADHQASSATDNTEASAGWYWQFNRKQGYKHDGPTRTPKTAWKSFISEQSDWQITNDPCALLLGSGWRLPAKSEWDKAVTSGGWDNCTETYAGALKLHAAGYLFYSDGSLFYRGSSGYYWSSSQTDSSNGWLLYFYSGNCYTDDSGKAFGRSVRCLRD
ncbi:MAG: PEGA domain-containing protein [Bacteroidales bacterium]|jgi:hypothetical protein|nr:PEGA domain-containing protein [Bacteroidales bacterium]